MNGKVSSAMTSLDEIRERADRIAAFSPNQAERDRAALLDVLDAVLTLHNEDGERWVGGRRADRQERYCTECNKAAPCPTVAAMQFALKGPGMSERMRVAEETVERVARRLARFDNREYDEMTRLYKSRARLIIEAVKGGAGDE